MMCDCPRSESRHLPGCTYAGQLNYRPEPGQTFTDLGLYHLLQKHLAPVFWAEWDRLAPEMQHSVAALANEIWERLSA